MRLEENVPDLGWGRAMFVRADGSKYHTAIVPTASGEVTFLTGRQVKLFVLSVRYGEKKTCAALGLARSTIANTLGVIYRKLGVEHRWQALEVLGWTAIPPAAQFTIEYPAGGPSCGVVQSVPMTSPIGAPPEGHTRG